MAAQPVWVTEHYWPGVVDELVLAQAQRLSGARDWWGTLVLPGQQTVFGLFLADGPDDVREAVARVAAPSIHVTPRLLLGAAFLATPERQSPMRPCDRAALGSMKTQSTP